MLKQEIASLEESLSTLEPGSSEPMECPAAHTAALNQSAGATSSAAREASIETNPAAAARHSLEAIQAIGTSTRPSQQVPRRISVGFSQQEAAHDESAVQDLPIAQVVRPEDLVRQLTQLLSQNTELMTQLDEANSSLASSQELCGDLEVSIRA